MEFRRFQLEVRDTDEDAGVFTGLANAFGVVDSYGSVFDPGAFKKTLNEQEYAPIVWFHDPTKPIGAGYASETDEGLMVDEGKLDMGVEQAREVLSGMQHDPPYITEMSIGFDTIESETDSDGIEHKKEVKLYELSLLPKNFGANPGTWVEARSMLPGIRRINENMNEMTAEELDEELTELREVLTGFDLAPVNEPSEGRPYPGEHACRLRDPGDFEDDSFRRVNEDREHEGKPIDVIYGKLEGEDTMTEQAYRYPDDDWSADAAKSHCQDHDGIEFEPAEEEDSDSFAGDVMKEVQELRKEVTEFKARVGDGSRTDSTSEGDSPPNDDEVPGLAPGLVEEIRETQKELNL